MRTTVTLEDDVEQLVRERMAASGVGFKQALNDAIRAGALESDPGAEAFELPTADLGRPMVDLTKANTLAGDLVDADGLAKMLRGR